MKVSLAATALFAAGSQAAPRLHARASVPQGLPAALSAGNASAIISILAKITPTATPSTIPQASAALSAIAVGASSTATPLSLVEYVAELATAGLLPTRLSSLASSISGLLTGENSSNNNNPAPPYAIYPKYKSCDSPYTVSEAALRGAIYIPSTFTYGKKPPVILFPGTGNTGFETFGGTYVPLLKASSWADPVWVNVNNSLLNDAQLNAQYAAYAMNYIAAVTKTNVTVLAWSQGNIDVQWALKYYPSTRNTTADHVAISADYAGTQNADTLCLTGAVTTCNPSVWQQRYLSASAFITALRSSGGDSAYIPTTSVYSSLYDQVVQPQSGTSASAYILDARGVGATNVDAQVVCGGKGLAGTVYTHESMIVNPLVLALLQDAMTHAGPGQPSRLDLTSVCAPYVAPGLGLGGLLSVENAVAIAALGIVAGQPRSTAEPALLPFASTAPGSC